MLDPRASDILQFWFADSLTTTVARPEWFRKDAEFDATIAQRFGPLIEDAQQRRLDAWAQEARGALARLLLLDQFTRNVYRDTPRAFAGDALALAAAQAMVSRGQDRELHPQQRAFAYLPFEHTESLAAQERGIELFSALAAEHPGQADALLWAQKHRDIVARFGRFPHRNLVLGRVSTAAELAFLQRPGSRF